ncbi:M24 family metallopeptidase [Mycetocola zhujimingii]|uniref:Aminopeptidase P family protein n=1 Tax=Mycetocola zhujimingii TaxID=2079792 RepID=A0A2U1TFM1_9MICO|nr:Xaa-Pro peptidase family protein [Mycetocola zhujimingii]PWC07695.1 aminopeptidase P family protein [Mycetocola zhujimingii]
MTEPSPGLFSQRLDASFFDAVQSEVIGRMRDAGLDAIFTVDPEDVAYLTGFFHHPCERPVAVWLEATGRCLLLLPVLERDHAESQNAHADIIDYAEFPGLESPYAVLARAIDPAVRRAGHSTTISYERLAAATDALDRVTLTPSGLIMEARYIKHSGEIALHQEAARITDAMIVAGVELITGAIADGSELPSEAELAAHVGSVGTGMMYAEHRDVVVVSFMAGGLVYAGANSSLPHGLPSSYRLSKGDTFMLSLGCAVGGRFVEGERTFVLGEPTPEQRQFHDTIRDAQQRGLDTIRPGVECREANAACLDVIREAGFGDFILHRQGHGIGLGMHEAPWLEAGDATVLREGMVVSNEPGIYVPGHAGYRISDSMLVTADGARPLTSYPRSLADCTIPI